MQVGTRDAHLRPAHAWVIGAVVHADRQTVTFFVPESRSARVLSDLQDNGRVALGLGLASHEAYQLKGTYVSSRPTGAENIALQGTYRTELLHAAPQAGYPGEIARPLPPGLPYPPGGGGTLPGKGNFLQ